MLGQQQGFTHLYRKVPELVDARVPHPRTPKYLNHLHWIPMPLYKLLLHSLDGNSSICFALSLLKLHLKTIKIPKEAVEKYS